MCFLTVVRMLFGVCSATGMTDMLTCPGDVDV